MNKYTFALWGILFLFTGLFVPSVYATSFGTNIVTNGDAETNDLSGWTASGTDAVSFINSFASGEEESAESGHAAVFDLYRYTGYFNLEATLSQTIDISDLSTAISSGLVYATASGQIFSWHAGGYASITVTELDVNDNSLSQHTNGLIYPAQEENYPYVWTTYAPTIGVLNAGTKKLKIDLYAHTSPTANDDYVDFDNLQIILSTVPTVTTTSVTTYGTNSATMGGNVTSANGVSVTDRGVVYSSTDATPTIGETGVTQDANGSGTGSFSKSISSLTAGTTYYVRAYATNSAGTSYGSVVSFTTTTPPSISSVSPPSSATYVAGQNLDYTVTFSEAVDVVTTNGTPYLTLTIGSSAVHAAYVSGTGSTALTFRYTAASGDHDADGVALASNVTLNGGTIKDDAGNDAALAFTGSTAAGVLVDAVAPTIAAVIGPSAGTYGIGGDLDFTVATGEDVTVSGSPYIAVTVGGVTKHAVYVSGTGTSSLVFRYTLVSGDAGTLAAGTSITLDGGTIKDAAGNAMSATSFTAPTISGVTIDAVAPTIAAVTGPSAGTYAQGDTLWFSVAFSEDVTVSGSPYIAVTVGSGTKQAAYVSGSGSTTLKFRYALSSGDYDADGIATGIGVTLNGGVIQDAAGNDAALTFTAPTTTAVLVDAVAPTITGVTGPSAGTYASGDTLWFSVAFSEDVTVSGTPFIGLTIGSAARRALYVSGSGTGTLKFGYEVTSGDEDADGIGVDASVSLNEGSIADDAGNAALLDLGTLGTEDVFVNNQPTIMVQKNFDPAGYSLRSVSSSGLFHVELPAGAHHAEIILLDAAGRRLVAKSLDVSSSSMDVQLQSSARWNLAILRVDGHVKASARGGVPLR